MEKVKISFFTFGCKINQYETQLIRESFDSKQYQEVEENDVPEIAIINTCTVTSRSDQKIRKLLRNLKQRFPKCFLIVTGCYVQRDRASLEKLPEIGLIIDNRYKNEIPLILENIRRKDFYPSQHFSPKYYSINLSISTLKERSRVYLKIQDGCQSFCSYCIIPYIRSTLQSKAPSVVLKEVIHFLDQGSKEIVLLGIHLGQYGREVNFSWNLISLLEELVKLPYQFRLRLSSLEMHEIQNPLLKIMGKYSHIIVPHLHIPLQNGDDAILRKMNRHYTTQEFFDVCEKARQFLPYPAITTDIIVGFPGETNQQFERTISFCKQVGFSKIHVFPYSDRTGTPASNMPEKIPEEEKYKRVRSVMEIDQTSSQHYFSYFIGKQVRVLAEEYNPKNNTINGYTDHYAKVFFQGKQEYLDQFVSVYIEKIIEDHLWGIVI